LALASREVWSVFHRCAVRRPGFIRSSLRPAGRRGRWVRECLPGPRGRVCRRERVAGISVWITRCCGAAEPVAYTRRQSGGVAVVLARRVIASAEADRWAVPLVYGSASVMLVHAGLLFGCVQRERDCAIALTGTGGERLAVA
jgi:hypothetical protein